MILRKTRARRIKKTHTLTDNNKDKLTVIENTHTDDDEDCGYDNYIHIIGKKVKGKAESKT